jgi:hypothetical protein
MQAEVIKKCSWCRTPILPGRSYLRYNPRNKVHLLDEFKLCTDCKEKYEKDMAYERAIKYSSQGQAISSFESNRMPGKY